MPQKPAFAFDAETLAEFNRLSDLARIAESFAPDADTAMGVTEQTVLTSLPIHIRGSHRNLGAEVPRGFPAVMRSVDEPPMILPRHQSGRLEFAQWLASPRHPLTARVYVNRVWGWHFGKPLVPSTENFGALGDRPSHPELLDWLARMFMENGWSTKSLHRMIVTSSVYQMDSLHSQEIVYQERDPENRWLWKSHLRRMDAEQIRDSLLAVSGQLSYQRGGKTVPLRNRQFVFDHTSIDHTKYESVRRAVYLPVIRNNLYTLFEQFDFPDPTMPTGFRNVTTVAPQALFFMNASLVKGAAQRLASQLIADHTNPDQRVQAAYELTLGRPAEVSEIDLALQLVADMALKQGHAVDANQVNQAGVADATGDAAAQAEQSAWAAFCQSLLSSNEFIYVR